MTEPLLACRDLRKSYGKLVAVDGVSFTVAPGETYGLLGPNGAGKTTTVSILCGLLEADDGEVTVDGIRMDGRSTKAKTHVGYVPQEIALYPDLSARDNLRFFGRLYGLRHALLGQRVEEALGAVGLADRGDDRVDTYSGGMKRRLNIAVGLLHHPKLLVLDEPTVGVDPQSRNAILEHVEDLSRGGMAVLYTTHYMEEAERLCDRVAIIDAGKIVAEGTHRELVELVGGRDAVEVQASGALESFASEAKALDGVEDAHPRDGGVRLVVSGGSRILPRVLEIAERTGTDVHSIDVEEPDLEAVFLHLTGKALRD